MANFNNRVIGSMTAAASLLNISERIEHYAKILSKKIIEGNKILIGGNGGSASCAEHFTGEIVGRFLMERRGLPTISLNSDTTTITAIANDYGYENIFSRQLQALYQPGDIFIGMTTSGNSKNIITAVEYLESIGGESLILLGNKNGLLKENEKTKLLNIDSDFTAHIQESHMIVLHYFAEAIELNYCRRDEF